MKRFTTIIAFVLCSAIFLYAQEDKKKIYIPESGDIAFGIDLSPVFRYVGNMFNNSADNTLDDLAGTPVHEDLSGLATITPDVSVMAKYMFSKDWGIRTNVGIISRTNFSHRYVQDDKLVMLNPFDETKLIDDRTYNSTGASVMVGMEYRKGRNRVQGVFNFGVIAGAQNHETKYNYANAVTQVNQQPSSAWTTYPTYGNGYRLLEERTTMDIFAGLTAGMGVECFVAPKVALGAEVNFNAYYVIGGQTYEVSEGFNTSTQKVEVRTDLASPGSDGLHVGIDNLGGSLYMAFYF